MLIAAFHVAKATCHEERITPKTFVSVVPGTLGTFRCWALCSDLPALGAKEVAGYPFIDWGGDVLKPRESVHTCACVFGMGVEAQDTRVG